MSTINVTNLSGRGGATPNLPDGANITGVATASGGFSGTLTGTGLTTGSDGSINVTSIKTVGVSTLGNVVITGAVGGGATVGAYAGVTTFYGDGAGLTGVGETIAPWNYNPDVNDTSVSVSTGIGISFNKKISAGSGTATLKVVNAGTAGTTIQSWGISSTTIGITDITFGSLVSDLLINQTYQVDIPEGFVVSSTGTEYVGTAYTFTVRPAAQLLWSWGYNGYGQLGQNTTNRYSSPVQIPGDSWGLFMGDGSNKNYNTFNITMGGELWGWGANSNGQLVDESTIHRSSPVKIGSDTNWSKFAELNGTIIATKTDNTLWAWGGNGYGQLGLNEAAPAKKSSPVQIPGTTWNEVFSGESYVLATKTNGTLWAWGRNNWGQLGHNNKTEYSSPVQIPGTTWRTASGATSHPGISHVVATKTDGTAWAWGNNENGQLGQNDQDDHRSSPTQIPGTSWSSLAAAGPRTSYIGRTDGTLWAWGDNYSDRRGVLGQNSQVSYSSPVQIPGTTWGTNQNHFKASGTPLAMKTDGTIWSWGYNSSGSIGQNSRQDFSSPVQIGSETDWISIDANSTSMSGIREDTTP